MADRRLWAAAFACAVGALPGRAALADPPTADGESPAAAPVPDGAPSEPGQLDDVGRARLLFHQAESKYAAGDVAGALDLMEQSYGLSGRPELLFNLGQLNRELGRCRPALDRYRQYLEQAPTGHRREDAARSLDELGRECPEPAAALPPQPPPPPPVAEAHRPYWTAPRIAGWSAVGAGVAAGTGAVLFGLAAQHAASNWEALNAQYPTYQATRADDLKRDGERYQAWEIGLGVASAGMLTGGVLLLVLGAPAKQSVAASLSLCVAPGGANAAYSGKF